MIEDPRINETIRKLNKGLEELKGQKELISQDLNLARKRIKEIQSEIKKSFWSDFLIGGLLVFGLFLVINSFELVWPFNFIVGIIIFFSGIILVVFRYSFPKLKEKRLNKNLKKLKVKSFINKAGIEFYKEDYLKAIRFWDKALELNPRSPDALNGKGATLSNAGEHRKSIPYFNKALRYEKKDISIWMNKGITKSLKNLTDLNLYHNLLESLPEELDQLTSLFRLNLNKNRIKIFPKIILLLNKLTDLDLKANQLIKIPESICNLKQLR